VIFFKFLAHLTDTKKPTTQHNGTHSSNST